MELGEPGKNTGARAYQKGGGLGKPKEDEQGCEGRARQDQGEKNGSGGRFSKRRGKARGWEKEKGAGKGVRQLKTS